MPTPSAHHVLTSRNGKGSLTTNTTAAVAVVAALFTVGCYTDAILPTSNGGILFAAAAPSQPFVDANATNALAAMDASAIITGRSGAAISSSSSSSSSWYTYGFPFDNRRRSAIFRAQSEEATSTTAESATTESADVPFTKTITFVIIADFILLCLAALFAGLTLAVMGLDTLSLEIIASSGAEPDRSYAERILPLRRNGNQLLCTLVFGNVMVNTLIAQITDSVAEGWIATAISTALITVAGEIIPQASMSAHALLIGSKSSGIVRFFMFLFWPICKPTSLFLDAVIGSDPGQVYSRNELKRLMMKHTAHSHESGVDRSDLDLMVGAIELKEKSVMDVLTPLAEVYMLEANRRLNDELLQQIAEKSHSRIPVYSGCRNNVVGVLHAKDLLMLDIEDNMRVLDVVMFYQRKFHTVPSETKLYSMLRYFQTGKSHIALVQEVQQATTTGGDPFYAIKGVVTLEDVMEQLIQREIMDEHDFDDAQLEMGALGAMGSPKTGLGVNGKFRKNAARVQRRIHLSANQLTACALFLQRTLNEFSDVDPQLLAATIGQYSTVYRIRPPADASGLSWTDPTNVMLYAPLSAGGIGAEAAAAVDASSTAHSATVMTLIISGRAEVGPALLKKSADKRSAADDDDAIVDTRVVAELPSWSVINVQGMRSGTTCSATTPIDYYCRVTQESFVMQVSHTQFKNMVASLKRGGV